LNFDQAVAVVKQMIIKNTNAGHLPVTYSLMPIAEVQKRLKLHPLETRIVKAIDDKTITNCLTMVSQFAKFKTDINQLHMESQVYKHLIPQTITSRISYFKVYVESLLFNLKGDLGVAVKEFRSGESKVCKIESFLCSFDKYSAENIQEIANLKSSLRLRIEMYNQLQQYGIQLLDKDTDFKSILRRQAVVEDANSYDLYVLFIDGKCFRENYDQILDLQLLIRYASSSKSQTHIKTMVVDCDLHPTAKKSSLPVLQLFQNGVLGARDLITEDMNQNVFIAKVGNKTNKKLCLTPPRRKEILRICCPTSINSEGGSCSPEPRVWICYDCKGFLQVDLDNKEQAFCSQTCCRNLISQLMFRCKDPLHGLDYEGFHKSDQEAELKKIIEGMGERVKNILILGETGVGKSTWINGVANYIHYMSLEQALEPNSKLYVPIPTNYRVQDETVIVTDGDNNSHSDDLKNEVFEIGQSSTQMPTVYSLCFNEITYKLIDTPGMGDSRGVKQDKENMQHILASLNAIDHLHCICILMKPNVTRLNTSFTYCIVELLTHLHKSASQNIVFCFTNTRSTFYEAPETLSCLNAFFKKALTKVKIDLSPSKTFFFDNEAFRLLALSKNGIAFKENVIKDFSGSWAKSSEETAKLLDMIDPAVPHLVEETISLNEAKELILNMAEPLKNVCADIKNTCQKIEKEESEAKHMKAEAADWGRKKTFQGVTSVVQTLDRPYTACTNEICTTSKVVYHEVTGDKTTSVIYKACHQPCGLDGIPLQRLNDAKLTGCWAFNCKGDPCTQCEHSYQEHMHMITQTQHVPKTFDNLNATIEMNAATSKANEKDIYVAKLNTLKGELELEVRMVISASARFAWFLKENAIAPYNDYIDEQIEMSIKNAEMLEDTKKVNDLKEVTNFNTFVLRGHGHGKNMNIRLKWVREGRGWG
jgi:GTPase SAR1 family protein